MPTPAEQLEELQEINSALNGTPFVDDDISCEEDSWWADTSQESFWRNDAIIKARTLRSRYWPAPDITIVTYWTEPWGAADKRTLNNALAVKVAGEIYILDNRTDEIYLWTRPPFDYLWDRQQVSGKQEFRDARGGLI